MATDPALQEIIDRAPDEETPPPAGTPPAAAPTTQAELLDPKSDGWLATQSPEVQKYVTELRNESKGYRQRARGFEELFEGYDDDDAQFLKDLVRDIKTAPGTAAQRAQQLVDALAGAVEAPASTQTDEDRPLTAKEVAKMLEDFGKKQDQTAQQREQLNNVYSEAEKLGYKQNTRPMVELLWVAANECNDDIAAAHKKLEDERQAIIDEAFDKKRTAAETSHRVVTRSGSAPGGDKPIKSIKDASKAFREALDAS